MAGLSRSRRSRRRSATVRDGPRFEVVWCEPPVTNRLDYALDLLGHARYDLPVDGQWSDVTASFEIVVVPEGIVLALDDVHVM